MPKAFEIKVITPQGVQYDGHVTHASIPVEEGLVGVLADHAPYITSSKGGVLGLRDQSGFEKRFDVGPGFFDVLHNQASFITESFNEPESELPSGSR